MAETSESALSVIHPENTSENKENEDETFEPEKKKVKLESSSTVLEFKLEERLSGILCCAVCLDLPRTCFQCANGHLMCCGCFNHLLADARLKDETSTCPNCRCEISKTSCTRNLAVEKAVSELPSQCQFCCVQLPRNSLEYHERELCQERPATCKYKRIGCPWKGPFHDMLGHEDSCTHPQNSGLEIMDALNKIDDARSAEHKLFKDIFSLLSFEKLKPYRTDDFITRLFYESSRFSAFNHQWVIRAKVTHDQKDPAHSSNRALTYQLVLKSKLTQPISLHYVVLKGPYGDMKVNPAIYRHEFTSDSLETTLHDLPIIDSIECNKLLASKTMNMRLLMFQ
ncbi:CYR1B-like protein, partial [Mya arenaria]